MRRKGPQAWGPGDTGLAVGALGPGDTTRPALRSADLPSSRSFSLQQKLLSFIFNFKFNMFYEDLFSTQKLKLKVKMGKNKAEVFRNILRQLEHQAPNRSVPGSHTCEPRQKS